DGKEIAFGSTQDGKPKVWMINSNGGTPRPFMKSELSELSFPLTWSPGANILYQRQGHNNYHLFNPQTEEERPLLEKPAYMFSPRYSPDTKSVAVYWNGGYRDLWLVLVSLVNSSQVLLYRGPEWPIKWSFDGKWIYAYNVFKTYPLEILKIPIAGGQPQTVVTLPIERESMMIDMSPDEKQIVCAALEKQSDVWMVENFDPESELEKPIATPALPEMQQLTYLQNGWTLFKQKKYTAAEQAFRQGLELNPKHLSLLYELGRSLNNQKKYIKAGEAFQHGFEIAPEHPGILNGLGYALAAQGRYAKAEIFAEKALAKDSSFANYNLLAWVLVAGEIDINLGMTFAQKALASKLADWPQIAEINQ
ncbi:tetratricopeptide repeat protein, partial [bacterium]|nr:tetratricopeptide repeat protein [bacterium]